MSLRQLRRIKLGFLPHFRFSVETETSSLLEKQLNENLLATGQSIRDAAKEEQALKNKNDGPKWMKFFQGNESLKVDVFRSLRNENQEMILNYIRMNYMNFGINELIIAMVKSKSEIIKKIFWELKFKVVTNPIDLEPLFFSTLLTFAFEMLKKDTLLSKWIILQGMLNYEKLDLDEKNLLMYFCFETNMIQLDLVERFLEENYFEEGEEYPQAGKFFKSLNPENLCILLKLLSCLEESISSEYFRRFFPEKKLTILHNHIAEDVWNVEEKNFENVSKNSIEKIIPEQIPSCFTLEQQINLKKLITEVFMEKLNMEKNFGRSSSFYFERFMIWNLMNSIFRAADNFLIKDALNLLSQALTKDWQWKESKNDWRLMQTFSRFNIINKFFMNENLLALPGAIRNIGVMNKKESSLEEGFSFVSTTLENIKSFFDLNYNDFMIASEGNEFLKTNWDQLRGGILQFLLEYLKFLTTPKLRQTLSELMATPLNTFAESDEKTDEKFKEILALKEEELDLKNFKIKIENLMSRFDQELSSKKIQRLNFYDDKTNVLRISFIKIFTNIIDVIKSIIQLENSSQLIAAAKIFFENPELLTLYKNLIYFPNLLENCLILQHQVPDIFPQSFSNLLLEKKNKINRFFQESQGDPLLMIANLEKEIKKFGKDEIPKDYIYYDSNSEYFKNVLYHNSKKIDYSQIIQEIQKNGKWKCSVKPDFMKELYSDTDFNLYVKILNSAAFQYLMNESLFKQFTERALIKSNMDFIKNDVDFPFYTDFVVTHKEKTKYIIVQDLYKLMLGAEKIKKNYFKQYEQYLLSQKKDVFFLKYETCEIDENFYALFLINLWHRDK